MWIPNLASLLLPVASLGGPTAGLPVEAGLLAALPAEASLVIHLPNPKALMASRETNRWVGFATDAEWGRLLGPVLAAVGDDVTESEVAEWRERVLGALEDSTDLVGFATGLDDQEASLGLIVRGGEKTAALLRLFIGGDARVETIDGGHEVLLSAAGRAELYYEFEGLIMVLSTPTVEGSKAVASGCLASLAEGELPPLFLHKGIAERRRPGAAFEFALDLSDLTATEETGFDENGKLPIGGGSSADGMDKLMDELKTAASSVQWVYGTGELGLGETANWNLYAPFDSTSLIGKALGFFGEADKSLLAAAPAGSISATVGAFDINGFTRWALDTTRKFSEDAYEQAMGGLSAAKSAVGVDLLEDIVGPMRGQFLGFSTAPSTEQGGSLLALTNVGSTTFIALTEETDPLLDLFDSLLEMSGMGDTITNEQFAVAGGTEEMELWRSDASTGLPVTIGVGNGRLLISSDAAGSQAYLARMKGEEGVAALLDDKDLAGAVAGASGAIITIQPTVAMADALEGLGAMMDSMNPEVWLPDQDMEDGGDEEEAVLMTMTETMRNVASLARQYFSGTTTSEFVIGDGIVELRTRSK
ncbi:hypothetical protein Poly30_08570 [Planctomycetes bacterium Poly30]|uniref:DUF3352 domain-containing protein n=1 Tax=Saltatorellus ferox TaxID=2528018 RepID=A0A518EMP6_9BACT|nr:hypothetical protein Poly30_08570 [Planctomycetes bacterium Poly30]